MDTWCGQNGRAVVAKPRSEVLNHESNGGCKNVTDAAVPSLLGEFLVGPKEAL